MDAHDFTNHSENTAARCRRCGRPATIRGFCADCARLLVEELRRVQQNQGHPPERTRAGTGSGIAPKPPKTFLAEKPSAYVGKYVYRGRFTCPVCDSRFESLKVSFSRLRLKERHSDFHVEYHDFEPEVYYITVCRFCGYAAPNFAYTELTPGEKKTLGELAVSLYDGRDFTGERSVEDALECFRRAELFAQKRRWPHGLWGTILLHRAWLLRGGHGDDSKEEEATLASAAEHFRIAYESESRLPGTMTKQAFAYLIGEISRRLGNIEEAVRWYSEVLKDPAASAQPALLRLTRQQWQLAREARGTRQKETAATIETAGTKEHDK